MIQQQTRAVQSISEVRDQLNKMESQIKMALPSHIKVDKFIRVVMTAIQTTPDLLNCDRGTLFSAALRCAADGLLPDGREAAIIPFNDKNRGPIAQLMPMVGGIMKKARNSGEIKTIDAQVVYENDKYRYWIDEKGPHFEFEKARQDRGKPILAFAYAITKDNGFFFEEMTEEDIQKVRNVSRARDKGPWAGPFADEMKRKTVIRRLAKYRLPSSTDLDDIVRADDDMYELDQAALPKSKTQELSERLKQEQLSEPEVTSEGIVVSEEFNEAAAKAEADMRLK